MNLELLKNEKNEGIESNVVEIEDSLGILAC